MDLCRIEGRAFERAEIRVGLLCRVTPMPVVLRFAAMKVLVDSGSREGVETLHGRQEIGFVDAAFARQLREDCWQS